MEIERKSNNFDFLRLLFSLIVAMVHCAKLSEVDFLSGISQYLSSEVAVDSFFIISGFLIFMSYDSSKSLSNYASKRLRRIFPGYISVIVLCSILLYAISSKSFFEYANIKLLKYILFNVLTLNFMHPTLPGVFEGNSIQAVNGVLWTIKIEVAFYITVPPVSFLIFKLNKALVLSIAYLLSILYSFVMFWLYYQSGEDIYIKLERQLPGQLAFFISGAAVYYFYNGFYKNRVFLLTLSLVVMGFHQYFFDLYFLYPASLAIIILYIATAFKYLGDFGQCGDLSFGIYIWHFPILQVLVFYNMFVNPVLGIGLFLTAVIFISYLSWHLIEKRYLSKSSYYISKNRV